MGHVSRGDMPEPGGIMEEQALQMAERNGKTEDQVVAVYESVAAQFIDLMTKGSTLEAEALLLNAINAR